MLWLLGLSFISTNLMHAFLLTRDVQVGKETISHHAAAKRLYSLIFIIGHFLGGLFFLLFSYRFFYTQQMAAYLFWLAVAGIVFEQLQAIIPARGKLESIHTFAAGCMAVAIALILLLAPFTIHIAYPLNLLYWAGISSLVIAGSVAALTRKNFHIVQMQFFVLFYLLVALLVIV